MSAPRRNVPTPPEYLTRGLRDNSEGAGHRSSLSPVGNISQEYPSMSSPRSPRDVNIFVSAQRGERDRSRGGSYSNTSIRGALFRDNIDNVLDAQGLSNNAVQVGIMRGKIRGLELELQMVSNDCRDANERLAQASAKLNEQKLLNSSLMHKMNSLLNRVSDTETSEKMLEEALLTERRAHTTTRDALIRSKELHAELEESMQSMRDHTSYIKSQCSAMEKEELARLSDRTQFIPTDEYNDMYDRQRKAYEALMEQVRSSFDRIASQHEEDETSIFIARSAVLSSATDLETKLCHADATLTSLGEVMRQFKSEFENETGRMLVSLMTENKELWQTVAKQQSEMDRVGADLSARGSREDYIHKDKFVYIKQQVTSLEEKLSEAHRTIEHQTASEREHANRMRELMDSCKELENRLSTANEDIDHQKRLLDAKDSEIGIMTFTIKQHMKTIEDLESNRTAQMNSHRMLQDQIRILEEEHNRETRATISQANTERDEALETARRLRSDLEDTMQRLANSEKELDSKSNAFNQYKQSSESQYTIHIEALQGELEKNRTVYGAEIEELQRKLSSKSDEVYKLNKLMEKERAAYESREGSAKALEEQMMAYDREMAMHQQTTKKLEEHIRKLQSETEMYRVESHNAEVKCANLAAEYNNLSQQMTLLKEEKETETRRYEMAKSTMERESKELVKSRTTLIEEVTKLRAKVTEDHAFKALKERMEKDKEDLMNENVRLHQQYQEVHHKNVTLQSTLTSLNSKTSNFSVLQSNLEDLQRKLVDLPRLRQTADEARREAVRCREEMESLRQERDEMSQRLELFLEESRVSVRKDDDAERLFREASCQIRRLDQQVEEATQRHTTVRSKLSQSPIGPGNEQVSSHNTSILRHDDQYSAMSRYITPDKKRVRI